MSAIAGLARFDGAPAQTLLVERMTGAMASRAPDGVAHWAGGGVALGQGMLRTTPESLDERQPLANEDASVVLVLDGRVDNPDELRRALLLRGAALRDRSDAELVLRAYEAWGEDCPDRLVGEYAFFIWDGRRRQLFAARDPAGTRHFYYHAGDRWFAFASEIKALLALNLIELRLNERRLLETLVAEFDREDEVGTCYAGIDRLPAGYAMRVTAQGVRSWRCWDPSGLSESRYASMDDCADAFREQLRLAVSCRLRAVGGIGAALSGGLDSSSVVGLIVREKSKSIEPRLPVFTLVHEDFERCPEWQSVRQLEREGAAEATYIRPSVADTLWRPYLDRIGGLDEPFALPNGYTDFLVCEAARARGCRILFDGMAGDLLFHWLDESLAFDRTTIFQLPLILRAAIRHDVPWRLVRSFLRRGVGLALPRLLALYRQLHPTYLPTDASLLHRPLALQMAASRRFAHIRRSSDLAEHASLFMSGLLSFAHEGLGQIALANGIEPRSPFSDRRLIEFAIRMPRQAKLCKSWYKALLRKAMAGIIPDSVRWRRDVTMHPGGEFRNRFIAAVARGEPGFWDPAEVERTMARWVDPASLRREWHEYEQSRDAVTGTVLLTFAVFARWIGLRFGFEAVADRRPR